jgi:hypothetical protein
LADIFTQEGVKFVFVYIAEAHAVDEWPVLSVNDSFRQHVTLGDRYSAALAFLNTFPLSRNFDVILDNPENEFNLSYSSWPTRYWAIRRGKVAVKMMPDIDRISLDALSDWLFSASFK